MGENRPLPADQDARERDARLRGLAVRYREPLARYFQRRGVPAQSTEDCVQDVFVRIARADQNTIDNAEAYLFTIASSVVIDRVRRRASHREDRHDPLDTVTLPWGEVTPARVLEGKEALTRLTAILGELSPRTREMFLLNRLDGLTYTQLAARYGVNTGAIEKQMSKALALLRRRFPKDERH